MSTSEKIRDYLELYYETPLAHLDLPTEDFEDMEREEEERNAVFRTWVISFDQIRRENEQAAALLSLISFFDSQDIPESLLRKQILGLKDFWDALGLLKGLLSHYREPKENAVDLHRLVRICIQGWLRIPIEKGWMGRMGTLGRSSDNVVVRSISQQRASKLGHMC